MTYIPGTGEIKIPVTPAIKANPEKSELVSVVNVSELKNPVTEPEIPDPEIWYFQLQYWIAIGSVFSIFFVILAFSNYLYLLLVPLGPYAAYLSWHIRKKLKRHLKDFDAFS